MPPLLTRPIYWNVEFPGIDLLMLVIAIGLSGAIAYGIYRRFLLWKALGQAEIRWDHPLERSLRVLGSVFGQRRIVSHAYAGQMHTLILIGFTLLFIGTCLVAIERDLGQGLFGFRPVAFFYGHFYEVSSLFLDIAGLMVVVGCCMALCRRFIEKPVHIQGSEGFAVWSAFLLIVTLTGFYLEAARIAHSAFVLQEGSIQTADPALEKWVSPVGYTLARMLPTAWVTPTTQHRVLWWGHAFLSFGFILGFGYSVLRHGFTGIANQFFASLESTGTLQPIPNIEESETFGVTTIEQFSWKTLFDSDVCVSCGRCELHCPASITGKPLSPKRIMQSIHTVWEPAASRMASGELLFEFPALVGNTVSEEELWACTTCGACMHQCPLFIEHIPAIVGMRRAQVMMESRFPSEAQVTLVNLEKSGNPWGLDNTTRADWAKGLSVPVMAEAEDPEILWWVGCAGSFDARAKSTTRALAKLLQSAGVRFAILGPEEQCCGDPARRIGQEYLYHVLSLMAVETMNGYGVKRIMTSCPHCFHTIKNEYPQQGGHYEVVHHTTFIQELIQQGRLSDLAVDSIHQSDGTSVEPQSQATRIVFHDSCYLGRHNDVYQAPRDLIRLAGFQQGDLPRHGRESFCCGAGGGRMWMEEHLGDKKINIERSEEVIASGAEQLAVACPFCKTMLGDGLKEKGREDIRVRDVAELLAEKLS